MKNLWILGLAVCLLASSCRSAPQHGSEGKRSLSDRYISSLEDAIKKNPQDTRPRFELGEAYVRVKEYRRAKDQFEKILDVDSAAWQDKAIACVYLAKIGEAEKDQKQAMKWYKKGLDYEQEKGTFVAGNMGLLLEKMKKFQEAAELYYKVLSRNNLSPRERQEFEERMYAISFLEKMKRKM